jgi:hypothetical protein
MSYIFYIWGFFDWTPIFWIFLIEPLSCCRATFQVAHWQIFCQKKNTTSQVLTMIKSIVSKKTDPVLYKGSIRLWKWPNYYTNIGVCILGRSDTIIIIKILYVLSAKMRTSQWIFKTKCDPDPQSLPSSPSTNIYTHWNTQQVFLSKPHAHPHWY